MAFSKKNQVKKLKRPKLKALDPLLSQVVRKIAYVKKLGYAPCWMCGKPGTQAAHIFSKKAYPKSRFDVADNVKWACFSCHKGSRNSMHENPTWFQGWYENKFGLDSWTRLRMKVNLAEATTDKLDTFLVRIWLKKTLEVLNGSDD